MPAPTVLYWDVTAAGNDNIGMIGGSDAARPPSSQLSGTENWGNVLGGDWKVKNLVVSFDNNAADQLKFWLFDHISDVNGTPNAENFFDGSGEWIFRIRVSRLFISSFSNAEIESSPWVDLPHGTSPTPYDLSAAIQALNPGNDGTTGNTLRASTYSGTRKFTNAFIYIAVKPHATALAGDHTNWGYRLTLVYP